MSLINTKKSTALQRLLTSAGFDVDALLAAGEDENPIADALAAAKAEGATEANTAFATALGLEATEDLPAAAKSHLDSLTTARTEAEASRDRIAQAVQSSLGVVFAAEQSADEFQAALDKAVATKTAKQIAQAGHEPIEQPAGSSGSASAAVADMSLAEAYTALAAESDPVKYKKIYNRIVELEAANN
jgi:hypothetical protein